MSLARNKLSEEAIAAIDRPGMHGDGEGLYLRVQKSGSRQWVFVYHLGGKRKEMGFGGFPRVSLLEARAKRDAARADVAEGRKPTETPGGPRPGGPTFGAVARAAFAEVEGKFKSDKHRKQWWTTLETYASPIWDTPVAAIDTDAVLACLMPIWGTIPETADRVRGRIERVLEYSRIRGYRPPLENAAKWKDNLALRLPGKKTSEALPHAAMPFEDVPAFVARLRGQRGIGAQMLELTILTAVRSAEATNVQRWEVHLEDGLWVIPAARRKTAREHRVPLVGRALEIMRAACEGKEPADYIFPGQRQICSESGDMVSVPVQGRAASNMTMAMLLRRMGTNYTVHGFRTSFRDWANEQTRFGSDVVAAALAYMGRPHQLVRPRGGLDERRKLMRAWDAYCTGESVIDAGADMADPPSYTTLPPGARVVAVIAGLETYRPNPRNQIAPVEFARADAEAFAEAFRAIYAAHMPEVELLLNYDVTYATLKDTLRAQAWGLGEEDLFIFYYAGHGFHDSTGNRLTVWDTSPGNIEGTTLSMVEDLLVPLRASPCRRVLAFIDACATRFQPLGRRVITPLEMEEFGELMRSAAYSAVFLSCRPGQQSYPDRDFGHGVWTHFLLRALDGRAEAALTPERFLTGASLQDYLAREVPRHVAANPHIPGPQTPEAMLTATNTFAIRHVPEVTGGKREPGPVAEAKTAAE